MATNHTDGNDTAAKGEASDTVDAGATTAGGPYPVNPYPVNPYPVNPYPVNPYPVRGVPSDNTTLVTVLRALEEEGFTSQLIPSADASIQCVECNETSPAADFEFEATRRLEGASDPDDMMVVVGARCPRCAAAGTLVLGYGPNASEDDVAISRASGGLA